MTRRPIYFITVFKKYAILFASGAAMVVIGVLTILLLLPNFRQAKLIFSQQMVLQQQKDRLSQKDKALEEVDYKYFQDAYPKINWVLPESKDFVSLFSTFDSIQSKTGLTVLKANFQLGLISTGSSTLAKTTSAGAYTVPLSIDVAGDIPKLQKFLKSFSDFSGRFITIDEIRWKFKSDGSVLAELVGKAYFYPVPSQIGSLDTPLPLFDKQKEEILANIAQISLAETEAVEFEKIPIGKRDLFQ